MDNKMKMVQVHSLACLVLKLKSLVPLTIEELVTNPSSTVLFTRRNDLSCLRAPENNHNYKLVANSNS